MKSGASDPFAEAEEDEPEDEPEDEVDGEQRADENQDPEHATEADDPTDTSTSSSAGTATDPDSDPPTDPGPESTGTATQPDRVGGSTDETRERRPEPSSTTTSTDDPTRTSSTVDTESSTTETAVESNGLSREELPYILRRDKVKDERPEVHQLFVQRDTHELAVDAERTLQDRLDEDLSRTDAREAIYRAGMQHLDDAEDLLRTWGYDL